MQSSAMMAVRAVTLFTCLAAVPLLAIFGKNLPAVIKSYFHSFTTNSTRHTTTLTERTDPPVFRPGLLASKSDVERPPSTPAVDGVTKLNAGVLPARPLVPIDATVHRADSPTAPVIDRNPQTPAVSSHGPSPKPGFPPDYFRDAELRLRQLGATYYLLETVDADAGLYRFFCKVALGSKPDETLAFFATDRDPLAAMHQVVRQIEGWQTHAHPY
jgi:hypothetical protein